MVRAMAQGESTDERVKKRRPRYTEVSSGFRHVRQSVFESVGYKPDRTGH